jgi:hypothetical protein
MRWLLLAVCVVLLCGACEEQRVKSDDPAFACGVAVQTMMRTSGGGVVDAERLFDRCLASAERRAARCTCPPGPVERGSQDAVAP